MISKSQPFRWLQRFLIAGLSFNSPLGGGEAAAKPLNPSGFEIQRGINLSHWLSQDFGFAPRNLFITENDIRFIAHIGYDHVRLPIDEKELWDEDGQPIEEAFALLNRALGWCSNNGLRVVIDLHTVRAHHFNAANENGENTLFTNPAEQERFLELWAELSRRFSSQPVDQVAYEILNECVADDPEDWNRLLAATVKQIRATEPDRVIVIGPNLWQVPKAFPQLKVPQGDKNIILSTHTYAPLIFTHYTAAWTPLKTYEGPVQYPGRPVSPETFERLKADVQNSFSELIGGDGDEWNADRMLQELQPAIDKARELGLQLYCGEFGCLPSVPRKDRLAYYRDLIGTFEANGIAWANWEYKGDFGIFEWHRDTLSIGAPDVEFIEVLTGERASSDD